MMEYSDVELRITALSEAIKYIGVVELGTDVCVIAMAENMFKFLKDGVQDEK